MIYAELRIKVCLQESKRLGELQLNNFSDIESQTISSESKPSAFPSALRSKRSAVQTLTAADKETTASIQRRCPKCERSEMRFYTQQLRSADEGSTVFFTCVCGFKYGLLSIHISHLLVSATVLMHLVSRESLNN